MNLFLKMKCARAVWTIVGGCVIGALPLGSAGASEAGGSRRRLLHE